MSFNLLSKWDDVPMQLERLNLSNNKLWDITSYLTQMKDLRWVDFSCNVLPTVSPLNRMANLQYIFMRNNKVRSSQLQIQSIRELAKLENVLELDFEANLIDDAREPAAFQACRNLAVLNLSFNPYLKYRELTAETSPVSAPAVRGSFCRACQLSSEAACTAKTCRLSSNPKPTNR
jgi:hypothetical protein